MNPMMLVVEQAWLQMVDIAQPTTNPEQISKNQEAHHRYLMWRATKVTSLFSWASILYLKNHDRNPS
jgi:hypothetical protein